MRVAGDLLNQILIGPRVLPVDGAARIRRSNLVACSRSQQAAVSFVLYFGLEVPDALLVNCNLTRLQV